MFSGAEVIGSWCSAKSCPRDRKKKQKTNNFYAIPPNTLYFTGGRRGGESESVVPRVFIVVVV